MHNHAYVSNDLFPECLIVVVTLSIATMDTNSKIIRELCDIERS